MSKITPSRTIDVLQAIYDSKINISLLWCRDGGVDAKVFGGYSGEESWIHERRLRSVEAALEWIIERILEHDPDSLFARRWKAGEFLRSLTHARA